MPKRIMILATNGFEQSELEKPKAALEEAGFETVVVSPEDGQINGWQDKDWGDAVKVDLTLEEAEAADFDALVLPGGQMNPDILRMEDKAVQLVKDFCASGKTVTSWPSIRTDLKNAGANVVDKEVATDGNLITSRNPDDIPAFNKAIIAALEDQPALENA